jgi:hypothetical protein
VFEILRGTEKPADLSELVRKLKIKFEKGALEPRDALTYVIEMENIPMENVKLYQQEVRVNTVVTQNLRRLKAINEGAITTLCSCGRVGCEYGTHKKLSDMLDALPNISGILDEMFQTGGVFVVVVRLDRDRMYYLDVHKFSEPGKPLSLTGWVDGRPTNKPGKELSPLNCARFFVYRRVLAEAVRKRNPAAARIIKDSIKRSEWEKCAKDAYRRISDAFDRAEYYLVRPDANPEDPNDDTTAITFSRLPRK